MEAQSPDPSEITILLVRAARGEQSAMNRLVPIVYAELRRIAHRRLLRERPDHTLNTTALVHEAYVRLAGDSPAPWRNREHFYAIAARVMRRVLIDHARARGAKKRQGQDADVMFPATPISVGEADMLQHLDRALERLATVHERQHQIVQYRFFCGLTIEETAEAIGVAPATVKRDWLMARAFLNRELGE